MIARLSNFATRSKWIPPHELPHLVLGLYYAQKGNFASAIDELRKAVELSHRTPLTLSALANVYARSGNKAEAERLLGSLVSRSRDNYVSRFYFVVVYAGLGQNDKAIDWLEQAYSDRSNGLVFVKVDPELDGSEVEFPLRGAAAEAQIPELKEGVSKQRSIEFEPGLQHDLRATLDKLIRPAGTTVTSRRGTTGTGIRIYRPL
jgi:tetratricopeptide (TPR) repeat protein